MTRQRRTLFSLLAACLLAVASPTVSAQTDRIRTLWPADWQVHWEGGTTHLTLTLSDDGSVVALAGDRQWTGTITGTFIELKGSGSKGGELRWRGWLTTPSEENAPAFLAGSLATVDAHGLVSTSGWYAIPTSEDGPKPPAFIEPPPDSGVSDVDRTAPSLSNPPLPPAPQTFGISHSKVPTQPVFEGRWETLEGTYVITREGKNLKVTTPGGVVVHGRVTGPASCVIGLRPGCCSGAFEDVDTLRWQDGSMWRRKPPK